MKSSKLTLQKKAAELFADSGYHSVSIKDIAKAADMSSGIVNYHFRTKEVLLKEILDEFFQSFYKHNFADCEFQCSSENKLSHMITAIVKHTFTNISGAYIILQLNGIVDINSIAIRNSMLRFRSYLFDTFKMLITIDNKNKDMDQRFVRFLFHALLGTIGDVLVANKGLLLNAFTTRKNKKLKELEADLVSFLQFMTLELTKS